MNLIQQFFFLGGGHSPFENLIKPKPFSPECTSTHSCNILHTPSEDWRTQIKYLFWKDYQTNPKFTNFRGVRLFSSTA